MNSPRLSAPQRDPTVDAVAIKENLLHVRERISAAAQRAGRSPAEVTLVAVSKTHPLATIEAALAAGQHDFGENRFEEWWEKVHAAEERGVSQEIRWHFIGAIQGRKSDQAVGPVALIHGVDRVKIAQRLSRDAMAASCVLSVLLEVNMSGEESKHGFTAGELRDSLNEMARLPGIHIEGLMTMAPLVEDPEEARPLFRALRLLRDELTATHRLELPSLSMGMTNDFEVAIEEGATLVRIGTAIFGSRL